MMLDWRLDLLEAIKLLWKEPLELELLWPGLMELLEVMELFWPGPLPLLQREKIFWPSN